MSDSGARQVVELVKACRPLFAGEAPEVQGAALADLTALWIAGHVMLGDDKAIKAMREALLEMHMALVRQLIPINFAQYVEPELKERAR